MPCPVCMTACEDLASVGAGRVYACARCGRFILTHRAYGDLPWRLDKFPALASILSAYIRAQQSDDHPVPQISTADIEALSKEVAPSPAEQRDALILWIGQNQASPVAQARGHPGEVAARIGAHKDRARPPEAEDGLQWLLQQVSNEGLFNCRETPDVYSFVLTMKGWDRFAELRRQAEDSYTAFMAMKFGDAELTALVDAHFRRAVEQTGFKLHVLTDQQGAGLIDNQIRVGIRAAAFVIADLTHDNNGAYFEAGFAEGIGLPVIYTCEAKKFKDRQTHFDTNHMVTVVWERTDLPAAANLLKQTIRNTLPTRAKMTDD